ncbi:hypothetical protein GGP77_002313 [Salinibacter ruber]|uniref:sulfotransferase n=1 Tax=Salinibacter ruber TaxID=146919 RepID=UPI002451155C|nr:hypothetical protein [Salinibacter ruber]
MPIELYETDDLKENCLQYDAVIDTPVPLLYPQIDETVDDCKFVLTVRDKEGWLDSMKWLLETGPKIWQWRPIYDEYNREFFGTASFKPNRLARRYDEYHREVEKYFEDRPGDLLTVDLSQSPDTGRLVEFLGLDQDPRPWPRSNTSRTPSLLQEAAYQAERLQWRKAGTLLRRIDNGIKRRLPNGD